MEDEFLNLLPQSLLSCEIIKLSGESYRSNTATIFERQIIFTIFSSNYASKLQICCTSLFTEDCTYRLQLDKKLIKCIEDIEALPTEEKDKVYYFIDKLSHHKEKKALK